MPQTIYGGKVGSELLPAGHVLTVTLDAGAGAQVQRLYGGAVVEAAALAASTTYGPYLHDMQFRVSALAGATVTVDIAAQTAQGLNAAKTAAADSLVSGAGNPTDLLTGPLQRVTITGALSTTATQAAAATGTYYKARVAWNNNGASGSAKLRIAVNCDNDVHGLMVGQNVKRRDHELTMGDAVMLVCGVPITRLTFSADGSITGGTHQLQVTFGN